MKHTRPGVGIFTGANVGSAGGVSCAHRTPWSGLPSDTFPPGNRDPSGPVSSVPLAEGLRPSPSPPTPVSFFWPVLTESPVHAAVALTSPAHTERMCCLAKGSVLVPGKLVVAIDEQTDSSLGITVLCLIFRGQEGACLRTVESSLRWYHLVRPCGARSSFSCKWQTQFLQTASCGLEALSCSLRAGPRGPQG